MNEQNLELVGSLLKRTQDGKVEWKRTADDDTFHAVVRAYVIAISCRADEPAETFELTILDSSGDKIETVSSWPYDWGLVRDESDMQLKRGLAELHEQARRRAHGAEAAIHAILQELNSPLS